MNSQEFKTLSSKFKSQSKQWAQGISNQTFDEIIVALNVASDNATKIAELEKENVSLNEQNKRVCSEIAELEKELLNSRALGGPLKILG